MLCIVYFYKFTLYSLTKLKKDYFHGVWTQKIPWRFPELDYNAIFPWPREKQDLTGRKLIFADYFPTNGNTEGACIKVYEQILFYIMSFVYKPYLLQIMALFNGPNFERVINKHTLWPIIKIDP